MKIYIQTRGTHRDYTFLGDAPDSNWWTHYGQFTAFEDPTLLVESDGSEWNVYLSAIPSVRKDRVRTPIRYTLVLKGEAKEEDVFIALEIIQQWLVDKNELQAKIDRIFEQDFVDDALSAKDKNKLIDIKLDELKREYNVGKNTNFDCNEKIFEFFKDIKGLLGGKSGKSIILNLLSDDEDAQDFINSSLVIKEGEEVSFLINDGFVLKKKENTISSQNGISSRTNGLCILEEENSCKDCEDNNQGRHDNSRNPFYSSDGKKLVTISGKTDTSSSEEIEFNAEVTFENEENNRIKLRPSKGKVVMGGISFEMHLDSVLVIRCENSPFPCVFVERMIINFDKYQINIVEEKVKFIKKITVHAKIKPGFNSDNQEDIKLNMDLNSALKIASKIASKIAQSNVAKIFNN